MNDNDLLDLIADQAPAPARDYADRVLVAGRRARSRRRLALAGAAVCVAAAVAAPIVVWSAGDGGREVAVVESVPAGVDQAEVYEVAISAILSDAMPAATVGGYYLVDQLCVNVLAPDESCQTEPFPADLRQQLVGVEHRQVRFVPADAGVPDQGILITLGPIHWARADLAEVPVSFRQAAQDGPARTYQVQLRDGDWVATGHR